MTTIDTPPGAPTAAATDWSVHPPDDDDPHWAVIGRDPDAPTDEDVVADVRVRFAVDPDGRDAAERLARQLHHALTRSPGCAAAQPGPARQVTFGHHYLRTEAGDGSLGRHFADGD